MADLAGPETDSETLDMTVAEVSDMEQSAHNPSDEFLPDLRQRNPERILSK
jgi:hypothetical protein